MSDESETPRNDVLDAARPGKYLTFRLGGETYAIDVLRVREIIRMTDITRVPRTPEFVRGVINLRGRITPIADLRLRFGLEAARDGERTCIVVVSWPDEDGEVVLGAVVDEVCDVREVGAGEIEAPPWPSPEAGPSFVPGIVKSEEGVVVLLDVERLLTSGEAEMVGRVARAAVSEGAP